MIKIKLDKNKSMIIIVSILFVSLLLNIYTSVMNSKYKIKAGKESYRYIEEIKHRNESALVILKQCIESKSISNEELLSLYKNYNTILDATVQLSDDYSIHDKESLIKVSKTENRYKVRENEVFSRIESLVFEYLNLEMKNSSSKLVLSGDTLEDFIKMKEVSIDVQDFLTEFNEKNLSDLETEKREKKIIRKNYWMDMYVGINEVIEKYIDYPFIIEKK